MDEHDDTRDQVAKLWTSHRELASAVWGDDVKRDNGLRSEVRAIREELDEGLKWAHEIWNVRRRNECLGIEALERHLVDHDAKSGEDVQMTVAEISAEAARTVAEISARANLRTQRWVVAGIIISALITVASKFL
jgi:DNA-binding winged helix-turn-helix (wHTH) protein